MKVALVERHLVGGTCVNTGCMPTKTLVASAYAAHLARRAADYGVVVDGAGPSRHRQGARRAPTRSSARRAPAIESWLARDGGAAPVSAATPASKAPDTDPRRRASC